jgi:hypothetical protein
MSNTRTGPTSVWREVYCQEAHQNIKPTKDAYAVASFLADKHGAEFRVYRNELGELFVSGDMCWGALEAAGLTLAQSFQHE